MADSTVPFTASAIPAILITAPEPLHAEADITSSADVESPYFDTTASTANLGSYFDLDGHTEATIASVAENETNCCLPSDPTSTFKTPFQDVLAWTISIEDPTPGRTRTGTDKVPLAIKPGHGPGSGRRDHLWPIVGGQGPVVGENDTTKPNAKLTPQGLPIHALWNQPDGKHREATGVIGSVNDIFGRSGPFTAALAESALARHVCTTECESTPPWQDSPEDSDAILQTRLHQHRGMIYRMMPRGGTIFFGIDEMSFSRAGFTRHVTAWILSAAIDVAREFNGYNLGIAFTYRPGSRHNVFNIRYDPSLAGGTLAQAFLPSLPRWKWHVGISRLGALSGTGYLSYIRQVLAHEFMHILGLRHWDAGFNAKELRFESVFCRGTFDGTRDTIMNTNVHPSYLRFWPEDLWVIRRFYRAPQGAIWNGRFIFDVII